MRAASTLFGQAVISGHRMVSEASVRVGTGGALTIVPIESGAITAQRGALVRQRCTITVPGREWVDVAMDPVGPMSPFAGELVVRRGIHFPDGTREMLLMGTFVIIARDIDTDAGTVSLTAEDRMYRIIDDRFEAPRKPTADPSTFAVITTLLQQTIPSVTLSTTGVTNRSYNGRSTWEESRAQAVSDMAKGLGADIFAADDGTFRLRKVPSLADAPSLTLRGHGPNSVVVNVDDSLSRDGVYNAVVVRNQPSDPADAIISVTMRDNAVGSPTKWGGAFGKKPRFYTSPLITSVAQAQETARGLLADSLGFRAQIGFGHVPDPRIEVGDVVTVDLGASLETHIIETLSIPLAGANEMTSASRAAVDTADIT